MAQKKIVEIIWTEPALSDLDSIADYIAIDNAVAAAALVRKIVLTVERVELFPAIGRKVPELPETPYREILVQPCRVLYKVQQGKAYIVLVIRGEQMLEEHRLWR